MQTWQRDNVCLDFVESFPRDELGWITARGSAWQITHGGKDSLSTFIMLPFSAWSAGSPARSFRKDMQESLVPQALYVPSQVDGTGAGNHFSIGFQVWNTKSLSLKQWLVNPGYSYLCLSKTSKTSNSYSATDACPQTFCPQTFCLQTFPDLLSRLFKL